MKKTVSIVFLISFMAGALQPVMPLIDYHLNKESIIELFCVNRDVPDSDCQGTCYLTDQLNKANQINDGDIILINTSYYPIGLISVLTIEEPVRDIIKTKFYIYQYEKTGLNQYPDTPPPQHA